jgi:hypothetical protein
MRFAKALQDSSCPYRQHLDPSHAHIVTCSEEILDAEKTHQDQPTPGYYTLIPGSAKHDNTVHRYPTGHAYTGTQLK